MNINFSDEDINFKKEVKDFISRNLSKDLQTKISNGGTASKEETIAWQKALNTKKWFAPGWPTITCGYSNFNSVWSNDDSTCFN